MTFSTHHRPADLWLKRYGIVFAAVVTNDLKPRWRVGPQRGFLRTASGTALRRHHVPLVKHFLLFFCKNKYFLALHTWNFHIRHNITS